MLHRNKIRFLRSFGGKPLVKKAYIFRQVLIRCDMTGGFTSLVFPLNLERTSCGRRLWLRSGEGLVSRPRTTRAPGNHFQSERFFIIKTFVHKVRLKNNSLTDRLEVPCWCPSMYGSCSTPRNSVSNLGSAHLVFLSQSLTEKTS